MKTFPLFFEEDWESVFNILAEEELHAFHHSDRHIFERIVFVLGRDPNEAMRVLAFWAWLEKQFKSECLNVLLTYPMEYIEAVYEESLMVLRVAESDHFPQLNETHDIPILQNILGTENANLGFFHENRVTILQRVGYHVDHIGRRAFRDIIQRQEHLRAIAMHNYHQYLAKQFNDMNLRSQHPNVPVGDNFPVSLQDPSHFPPLRGGLSLNTNGASSSNSNAASGSRSLPPQRKAERLREILNHTRMETLSQESIVPPSERTIFLTFSKGYPISETELWDFFRRTYGNIIESLQMQEVCADDQPLFAKLVVREASTMRQLLTRQGKTKFTINGKHVWARKFVRKNPNAPSSSSSGQNN